jgi:hypothetical protein
MTLNTVQLVQGLRGVGGGDDRKSLTLPAAKRRGEYLYY